MPYVVRKVRGKDCYTVKNRITGRVHSKCTTRDKAHKQMRLLQAIDHGFIPTSPRRGRRRRSPSPPSRRR